MCKKAKGLHNRIDPCMEHILGFINATESYRPIASCCGHLVYPMTIVVTNGKINWDLISNKIIPRKRRFYKKDSDGYYYIPETLK